MEQKYNLVRQMIPEEHQLNPGDDVYAKSYIYMTEGFLRSSDDQAYQNKDKVAFVIIQGSGETMRPGSWSRAVCVQDNFENGSMLPQIKWARDNNLEMIILNPNGQTSDETGMPVP